MNSKPIGIVVSSGCVVGFVNCDVPIHVIDLDLKEIWKSDEDPRNIWTEQKYRDFTANEDFDDLTGNSPYQNQPAEQA